MEWNVNPTLIEIGPLTIRYYSLLFMIAFLCGYYLMLRIFTGEGKSRDDLEDLFIYVFFGTVVGARLGHVLFYSPLEYLKDPLEILKVWHGGLASHGAAIGIPIALYLYVRKRSNQTLLWIFDRVAIVVALAGFFICLGNFFNHEIVGRETDLPWGVKFLYHGTFPNPNPAAVPRHPSQLYESLAYLLIFGLLLWLYNRYKARTPQGLLIGLFFTLIFGFRFFVEFLKENQESWESSIPLLNMGQILSIPLVIIGLVLIFQSGKRGPMIVAEPATSVAKEGGGKKKKKARA